MRKQTLGFLLVFPSLFFVGLIAIYPLIYNIFISFHQYNPLQSLEIRFVGLQNYQWAFTEPLVQYSLYVTLLFTVASVSLEAILGLFIAFALAKIEATGTMRIVKPIFLGIFILPWAIPTVSAAVSWRLIYHPMFGFLNALIGAQIMWLSDYNLALFSIIMADAWKTMPFFLFIFLAGIMSIPTEHFEAAKIDGASDFQEFRYIILPQIWALVLVALSMRAIDAFTKIFDMVYMLTGGGPGITTKVFPMLIYEYALSYFKFGNAATLAIISITISLIYGTLLLRRGLRK